MSVGFNPLIQQGQLNRIITHVIVPNFPQLSVTAPFMAKAMASVAFDEEFVDQPETATGIVNSPMPYVKSTLTVNLIRSQAVCGLWVAQIQSQAMIGDVTVYSDSTLFPSITISNASITGMEPGPFDGTDPTVKATVKGIWYTNSTMWSAF